MSPARRRRIETVAGFQWKFGLLDREQQLGWARRIDGLAGDGPESAGELVAGTRRLYRLRIGAWRLLYVSEAERVLLVTLECGRRPPARGLRRRGKV